MQESKLTSDWSVETMLRKSRNRKRMFQMVEKMDEQKVDVKCVGGNAERTQKLTDVALKKFIMKTKTTTVLTVSQCQCKGQEGKSFVYGDQEWRVHCNGQNNLDSDALISLGSPANPPDRESLMAAADFHPFSAQMHLNSVINDPTKHSTLSQWTGLVGNSVEKTRQIWLMIGMGLFIKKGMCWAQSLACI